MVHMACPAQLLDVLSVNAVLACSPQALAPGQCLAGQPSTAEGDKSPDSYTHSPWMQLTSECVVRMP